MRSFILVVPNKPKAKVNFNSNEYNTQCVHGRNCTKIGNNFVMFPQDVTNWLQVHSVGTTDDLKGVDSEVIEVKDFIGHWSVEGNLDIGGISSSFDISIDKSQVRPCEDAALGTKDVSNTLTSVKKFELVDGEPLMDSPSGIKICNPIITDLSGVKYETINVRKIYSKNTHFELKGFSLGEMCDLITFKEDIYNFYIPMTRNASVLWMKTVDDTKKTTQTAEILIDNSVMDKPSIASLVIRVTDVVIYIDSDEHICMLLFFGGIVFSGGEFMVCKEDRIANVGGQYVIKTTAQVKKIFGKAIPKAKLTFNLTIPGRTLDAYTDEQTIKLHKKLKI